ncbi:MAG: DNA polymerase III subunit delta [Bacteroidetes bacterium]|nr:DNA polymerase III subunit delta [Bacteroidota bacterium]
MSLPQFNALMSDIRKRKFLPVYFLEGDETYFIDKVADTLEETVLTEGERGFNQQIFYGRDVKMLDIVTAARRFPMMANHQVIIVREAQVMRDIELLLNYLDHIVPTTVLVILYKGKKINKATKLGKALKNHGLLTAERLKDKDMNAWLKAHLQTMGLTIHPAALELLVHSTGTQLEIIAGELEKIQANMGGRTEIALDDISKHTGLNKEYNIFELNRSLGEKNRSKALEIVRFFNSNPKDNPLVLVMTNMFNYFRKIHQVHFLPPANKSAIASALGLNPYFVDEYIHASKKYPRGEMPRIFNLFHEFDLRMKGMTGGSASENELLTELVVRIIK